MLTIGGIALVPIIVALVEVAKRVGMPHEYAPYLNGLLSVLGMILVQYVTQSPESEALVVLALQMIVLFLTNAGLYREVIEKRAEG